MIPVVKNRIAEGAQINAQQKSGIMRNGIAKDTGIFEIALQ